MAKQYSRVANTYSRVAKAYPRVAKKYPQVVKQYSQVAKQYSQVAKEYSQVANTYSRVAKAYLMQDMAEQISYWDRVANEKRFSHPLRVEWLKRYSNRQARMLDYGCGYGRTLAELSGAGYQNLVGVDFSEAMLARARLAVPRAGFVRNDGHSLPFQTKCFDAVLLFAVLTCIPDSNEQRLLLAEVKRVLRPGGLLYVSDLLVNNDQRNRERYSQYAEAYGCYGVFELPEGVVVRHHQREWIEEIVSPFEQLEYEPFTVTTMNGNASAAFQYLGRKSINAADEVILTSLQRE